jgi:hypothetical protein
MNQLYRIEELFTNGWELIDESAQKLTKEQCDLRLRDYMNQGYNPNYLRAVIDVYPQDQ